MECLDFVNAVHRAKRARNTNNAGFWEEEEETWFAIRTRDKMWQISRFVT